MKRYQLLAFKLVNEMQIMNIKEEIQTKVRERVDQNQREYILREQLKLIREELGEENTISDAEEFQAAADKLQASDEVKEKLQKEIARSQGKLNNAGFVQKAPAAVVEQERAHLRENEALLARVEGLLRTLS